MSETAKLDMLKIVMHPDFPRASRYDPEWVIENQMGPNVLWLTESLGQVMDLKPEMRVLDLGCGRAMSSIFLAREYGVQVWATDLWIPATENAERIRAQDLADQVFPLHVDAHALPFAEGFFDAVVSMDAYHYFGTDDYYLESVVKLLKPGGQIGIVSPGLVAEFGREVPDHLKDEYMGGFNSWCTFHSPDWWQWHWEKTRLVDMERAELIPRSYELWMQWYEAISQVRGNDRHSLDILRQDQGQNIGFVRLLARRTQRA